MVRVSAYTPWALAVVTWAAAVGAETSEPIVVNDDGAWCWFQDERAVVYDGTLLVASVACGAHDASRKGNIELTAVELGSGRIARQELFERLEADDHDVPALWVGPDGRLCAVFAKHGSESHFYYRIAANGANESGPLQLFRPSPSSRITYANLLFLSEENGGRGRLYNFYRGLDASFKPSFAWSDDHGQTWTSGSVVIDVPAAFRHRPYVKLSSNSRDTIHLLYTDGHPRDIDNSIYHVFYRDGLLHRSDGTPIRALAEGLRAPCEGTLVFRGDANNVAWVSDAHLSADGRPYVVFSAQKDSAGLRSGDDAAGRDHRYHYAWWDGRAWHDHEIAFAGTRLYAGEDDYTGNLCLHPDRLNTVFISTNADPMNGRPLISSADGGRHYEIFRGETDDDGQSWHWQAITSNSTVDNLRPIVPKWEADRTALLWFRGKYLSYRDYRTEVLLRISP
jgi:hypothetical protein